MFSRTRIALGLAFLASLIFAVPAFAGGWAVITLDDLPTNVVAGDPLTVGFTVLQHGKTPMDGLEPTIIADLYKEQEFVVNAEPSGKPGHYTATLTFPKEGEWRWFINAFTVNQLMPTLNVVAPVDGVVNQPVASVETVPASTSRLLIVRLSALGIGLVGIVFAFLRKSRLAMTLTALCLLVGVGSFVTVPFVPAVEAQSNLSFETISDSSSQQVEKGRQLFVAKGCMTCHVNKKVTQASDYSTIDMGAPNLTSFSASPEVLRVRLKDPSAAKSDSKMPDLGLNEVEIEALIAFINSE
jgi:cytochrome c2